MSRFAFACFLMGSAFLAAGIFLGQSSALPASMQFEALHGLEPVALVSELIALALVVVGLVFRKR